MSATPTATHKAHIYGARIAVVGSGSIGVAWTIVFARAGASVGLFDPDAERRRLSAEELTRRLALLADAGLLDERPKDVQARVETTDSLTDVLSGARLVQECAPEDLATKRELFAQLDELAVKEAILVSSSSAMRISEIADALPGRSRCLIAHPGNPPYLLPVVELVPAPFTDPKVVEAAADLYQRVGMSPVTLAREVEGFVFNRLQGAVLREAYCLVRDGVAAPEDIDRVMRDGPGRRWALLGPFETAELNTRGGIDEHARRLGPAYARMGAERGEHDPWTEQLVARVSAAVQHRFPRERWDENVEWRDRALMALEACRRQTPILTGPTGEDESTAKGPER